MDCLVSQTVPVYIGASKVGEFFNPDGIIAVDENVDVGKVVNNCTEQEYESRINAVKENYNRALKYLNINDLLYETYFLKDRGRV